MSDSVYSTWPSMIQYLPNSALAILKSIFVVYQMKETWTYHMTRNDSKVVRNLFCLIRRKF